MRKFICKSKDCNEKCISILNDNGYEPCYCLAFRTLECKWVSAIEDLFNEGWCPLYKNASCIPGLDTYSSRCPYKKGWHQCWYYITRDRK